MMHPVPVIRGRYRRPRQPGRPPKSGARALARHLAAGTLDRRTGIARDFYKIQDALVADRGGWSNVSAGEQLLIERVAAETLFLRAIEGWAFRQGNIIDEVGIEGPRLLAPLAKGYTSHLSAFTRALAALGLRPDKVERLPSLGEYLQQREAHTNGYATAAVPSPTPGETVSATARSEGEVGP